MKKRQERISKIDDISSLVRMDLPEEVFKEAYHTLGLFVPARSLQRIEKVFNHIVALYRGRVPGYRECNTGFHDLRHTTDVFLAMARLLHGMSLAGCSLPDDMIEPAMASALIHDTGYIQRSDDDHGTGGQYTKAHISRSSEYALNYLPHANFSDGEASLVANLIMATNVTVEFGKLHLAGSAEMSAGKALFISDLVGQMADRIYLEKLLFLYREFMEANIPEYKSEEDLLEKTLNFYSAAWKKIVDEAEYDTQHMRAHFRERWADDRDLYTRAVQNNMSFLNKILTDHAGERYREHLNREGMVKKLTELESSD
jgi:hypothetical protein